MPSPGAGVVVGGGGVRGVSAGVDDADGTAGADADAHPHHFHPQIHFSGDSQTSQDSSESSVRMKKIKIIHLKMIR